MPRLSSFARYGPLAALAAGGIGAFLSSCSPFPAAAHEPELSRYTYWRDIRPLLDRHCSSCHAGTGPAPVNLMRYGDALPWANSIARQVLERRMPPWLPDDGAGEFAHARTLDERETDRLVDWAIGLAPEGAPPEKTPDAVGEKRDGELPLSGPRLQLAEPVRIGELESEAAVCAPLVRGEDVPAAAGGFALVPGEALPILRRAVLFLGDGCRNAAPVFTWVVGQGARLRPEGVFDPLPPEAGLFLHLEYRKGFDTEGLAFEDAPQIVVFPAGKRRAADAAAQGGGGEPTAVETVAAGASAVEPVAFEAGATRFGPASLLAVLPPEELDLGGGGFTVEAVAADGSATTLLRITRFDRDWVEKFVFRTPVRLEGGESVRVSHPGAILDVIRGPDPAFGTGGTGGGSMHRR